MKLPEVVITERDATMFEMRKQGLTFRQIGKALGVSESTAYKGCKRISDKIVRQLAIDYGQETILELQRLDGMLTSFMPLTRPKKMKLDDGEEVEIPPSPDAANLVLKIMDRRAKLLGLDANTAIDISVGAGSHGAPAIGPAEEDETERTGRDRALELVKVMTKAGVFGDENIMSMLQGTANEDEIVDAEIVPEEGDEQPALVEASFEPPAFMDEYDEEQPEFEWNPEEAG